MKTLHISAGGKNLRLKNFLIGEYNDIPKHVLPIPGNCSIIEKIINDAIQEFEKIIIHCNFNNHHYFSTLFKNNDKVDISIDYICSGPLGPVILDLELNKTCYACAGDMVCNASWNDFIKFHNSHELPVSILVAKSTPVPLGAKFNIGSNNLIISWERVNQTLDEDLINIGYYIIEQDVLPYIKNLIKKDENNFFDTLISKHKVAGYVFPEISYNINTPISYQEMCKSYQNLKK